MWECPYCGEEHQEEDTMCCGEIGHLEWFKPRGSNLDHYLDDPRRGQSEGINRSIG